MAEPVTESLPIKFVHHLSLVTADARRSETFYREVLGFAPLRRPNFDFRGAWLYRGELQIHLIERPLPELPQGAISPAERPIDSRANHIAFAVEDVAAARSILERRGVPFREKVNAGGVRQLFFHDPDGHHIELAEYPHPSVELVP